MSKHVRRRLNMAEAAVPLGREHCVSGKLGFFSEGDALDGLARARERYDGHGTLPCRVYRCADCASWHLTSLAEWIEPERTDA